MVGKLEGRWTRLVLIVVAALAISAGAAACGSDSDSGSSGSSSSGDATNKYQARLDELYKGTQAEPTGDDFKPPTGKNIWVISTGQNIETSQRATAAQKTAAESLGWKVTVFDGKFDSARELTGIQQAIAAKADGIIMLYIDCAPVKSGLQQAKKAGIPIVGIEGTDCNPKLFSHKILYAGDMEYTEWIQEWGASQAAWVIAKTNGQAKTVINIETDLTVTALQEPGIRKEFAKCPTCEIVGNASFVGADFGPPLQEKISQQFIKHPDANSFIAAYDASLTSGGAQALKATGRLSDIKVMGGEGSVPGIKLIRSGKGMDACSGLDTGTEGWASMDSMGRLLANIDPSNTNSGIGFQICDKDHNLPPEGEAYTPPVDYEGAYLKKWGKQ
jgi:ribose transport system substrate-binding protein